MPLSRAKHPSYTVHYFCFIGTVFTFLLALADTFLSNFSANFEAIYSFDSRLL